MKIETHNAEQIKDLLRNAHRIAVVPSMVAGADAYLAGVALTQMLKDQEKDVSFVYIGDAPEGYESVQKPEETSNDVKSRELIVEIDYSETPAAKIHYATEDGKFILKLSPVPKSFDTDKVKVKLGGFDFDLIFVLGAQEPEDLGAVYSNLQDELRKASIINIDNTERNSKFGVANVIDSRADTLSLLLLQQAPKWGLYPSTKSAKTLLTGVSYMEPENSNGNDASNQ